jgi:ferritin-like metal-binding protein YciE
MTIRTMHDLFVHTLKDIFYVEKKLAAELPGMAKKANNPELRRAFEDHASQPRLTFRASRRFST